MLTFIETHAAVLQIAATLLTAAIWIIYLQVFVRQFVRQRRTHILINVGASNTLDARCFVANLAFEAIYISDIVMILHDHDDFEAPISDRTDAIGGANAPPNVRTYQGPLKSGEFVDIGSFRDLMERAAAASQALPTRIDVDNFGAFDIVAVANTPARNAIAAAMRTFDIFGSGNERIVVPRGIDTVQIRSKRRLASLKRDLEKKMLAAAQSKDQRTRKNPIAQDLPTARVTSLRS